jgi:hypothetical protein
MLADLPSCAELIRGIVDDASAIITRLPTVLT